MAQRILRPLGYADLFDELFDLYKRQFLLFCGMAALMMLPMYAILYTVAWQAGGLIEVLIAPFGYVVTVAATQAVSECYLGRKPTILSSYAVIRGKTWNLLGTMAVTSILIGLGYMLCLVPGIFFSIRYAFVAEVFVLEGKAWGDARARSKALGAGQGGRILTVKIISGLIAAVIAYALIWVVMYLAAAAGIYNFEARGIFYGVAMGLAVSLTTPIQVIASVLLYYDLRVRKEGFDIEMLAAGIGASASRQA